MGQCVSGRETTYQQGQSPLVEHGEDKFRQGWPLINRILSITGLSNCSYWAALTRCRSPEQTIHWNMNDSKRNQDVTTRLDHGFDYTRHIGVVMSNQAGNEGTGSLNSSADEKRFTSSNMLDCPHGGDDCDEGDTSENGLNSCRSWVVAKQMWFLRLTIRRKRDLSTLKKYRAVLFVNVNSGFVIKSCRRTNIIVEVSMNDTLTHV